MKDLKKIILIDDSKSTNSINKALIEEIILPIEVQCFQSGKEALDFLSTDKILKPDIILLDLNMPEVDGFEFLRRFSLIEKKYAEKSRPIIAIVSDYKYFENFTRLQTFNDIGIIDHIQKPLRRRNITELLDKYFL